MSPHEDKCRFGDSADVIEGVLEGSREPRRGDDNNVGFCNALAKSDILSVVDLFGICVIMIISFDSWSSEGRLRREVSLLKGGWASVAPDQDCGWVTDLDPRA